MKNFRLDRSTFKIKTFNEADNNRAYWLEKSVAERLRAAWYLTCSAYGININRCPPMDKSQLTIRSRQKENDI